MSEANTTWKHSQARLPRLYKQAGRIVQQIKEEGGSFKGLVFKSKQRNLKSLYALVAETLRHSSELDDLLRKTQILIKEPRLDPWVARVLITELLWRERPLSGPAIPLKIVLSYKPQLLSSQADLPKTDTPAVVNISRPRYVRINSLKVMKQEVLSFLKERGWEELNCSKQKLHYPDFIQTISTLSDNQFVQDVHIENLLVFPRNVQFYNMDYFHDSSLILQDKASCMVAHLLNPEPGSTVLDMCAAPGMKTTHIAASLNNRGTVYAIEKHRERYQSLVSTVAKSGATCVKTILGDALHFSHHRLPDVEYIVVDPTCSGSGMTARQDVFNDSTEVSKLRLNKLSGFQYTILTHAMTNFPKVKRILYSTCSMSPEENEAVVDDVLRNSPPNFKPIIPENGAWWMTPGSSSYTYGKYGLYAKPDTDLTNGFFVAVFERTDNDYESKERGNLKKESSEEVNKVENKNQENSNLSKPKIKKKKQKNSDSVSSPKPSINPALERMKKAMQNLGTINSGDDHSEILTKKRKKSESETFHKVEDQAEEILPKQKKKGKK